MPEALGLPGQVSGQVSAQVWGVGQLCRAAADALAARFNPVAVTGEVSGLSLAASGHCYFSLKDAQGQIRCAMFRRSALLIGFQPRDGDRVVVQGRLAIYELRGDLQLVVESMTRAGVGTLLEQFMLLKNRLQVEGLFDAARKRPPPSAPRAIGLLTSLNAAALHDVASALARRVPHIPVVLAAAAVQGTTAASELMAGLRSLYAYCLAPPPGAPRIDVIVVVRGGGALEDLWCFNDEALVRTIAQSPVPVVSGVGHETDFTLTDFVADLRAPTPTAAAELVAVARADMQQHLGALGERIGRAVQRVCDEHQQRLDRVTSRLGRPSQSVAHHRLQWAALAQRLQSSWPQHVQAARLQCQALLQRLDRVMAHVPQQTGQRLAQAEIRLRLLDPRLVLQRGYAWLSDADHHAVTSVEGLHTGQWLQATLADGEVELQVQQTRGI